MPDLCAHQGVLGVYRVGEPTQLRHPISVEHDGVAMHPSTGRDRTVGDGRHGRTAPGHLGVEVDQGLAHLPSRHHTFEGGGLDYPVLQCQRTQRHRTERRARGIGDVGT
jgi:hypothetical protein